MKGAVSIDEMVEAFDVVRKRFEPTNGECLAIFAVLASDVIARSGDQAAREMLSRPAIALMETKARYGDDHPIVRQAMKALFKRCEVL